MDAAENKATQQLRRISQCSICLNEFKDPRMLACIHTFCFKCIEKVVQTTERKPGEKMPCPLCRKEFTIPEDGLSGIQKNFFMQDLLDVTNMLSRQGITSVICDVCKVLDEYDSGIAPEATMRCLECGDNFCDRCSQIHRVQKTSRYHKVVEIGSEAAEEIRRSIRVKTCSNHNQKPLEYYCTDCKKIVCVSCCLEGHKLHNCKDVASVDEEFRQMIDNNAWKISNYAGKLMSMRKKTEQKKENFLAAIAENESKILERYKQLTEMIDRDTKSLISELSVIKTNHLKQIESTLEELERSCTILRSFEDYCAELTSKGSASDICSSVDELVARANEIAKDLDVFVSRPYQPVEISFHKAVLKEVSLEFSSNSVGQIRESSNQFKNCAIVVGLSDGAGITNDVVRINLNRPNKISCLQNIPTAMRREASATVFSNTIYVSGIGSNADEIWKFSIISGWRKCGSLVQGRSRHSSAFTEATLYICGGFVRLDNRVLDSVEAYSTLINRSKAVGRLIHGVQGSGNCVPYRNSLYIFGGTREDNHACDHVQIYDTTHNTCTLLSPSMPGNYDLMRAVLWKTCVILLGCESCLVFDIETGKWNERHQFRTDGDHFGLVLENERIFIIGGGTDSKGETGKTTWKCRDDVRYVSLLDILENKPVLWKFHCKLWKPSLIGAVATIQFPV